MRSSTWSRTFSHDAIAGLTVACVALPLNLAIALASGVPASMGLISGIVAGVAATFLGGARLQITGPEAALVPAVLAIAQRHGVPGVVIATCLCGATQIAFGLMRGGAIARVLPASVVRGFMAGIGVLILLHQLPVLLNLGERGIDWQDASTREGLLLGIVAIACLRMSPRFGALLGLILGTASAMLLSWTLPRVGALPTTLSLPHLPSLAGVDLLDLAPAALSLAFLASLGSMLSAAALDNLLADRNEATNYNRELIAQGVANLACGMFGGLPVMGAIVRSAVSVQAGAQTRAASLVHALMLLVTLMVAGSLVSNVPVAVLAAILVAVGIRLINVKAVNDMWKIERSAAAIVVVTATLIATTHVYIGIGAGLLLSLIISLARTAKAEITVRALMPGDASTAQLARLRDRGLVQVVDVRGALTLLSAERLDRVLPERPPWPKVLVLDLRHVPLIDSTATHVLKHALECLDIRGGRFALVAASGSAAIPVLTHAGLVARAIGTSTFATLPAALDAIEADLNPISDPTTAIAGKAARRPITTAAEPLLSSVRISDSSPHNA